MHRRRLYKYFSERKWAEAFLRENLLLRSLSYFRDHEDNEVRGDHNERTVVFRPEGGLVINSLTQGTTMTLPGPAFESSAKQEEIFVFYLSMSLTEELRERFRAIACFEILTIGSFCDRIERAVCLRPPLFPGRPGGRARLGQRVEYYKETEAGNPRWALPDMIAVSKAVDHDLDHLAGSRCEDKR
jgi:hypothetical protein